MSINKWVFIGYTPEKFKVYVHIQYDGKRLSLTGVEGPLSNGDAKGGCGQIDISDVVPMDSGVDTLQLRNVWRAWHLNDARAGCEHQRAMGWDKQPIDPTKPLDTYGKHFPGQPYDTWSMLAWATPKEHPNGLLGKPCEVCGYKYGSAWLHEDVPQDVISFLESLPAGKRPEGWS